MPTTGTSTELTDTYHTKTCAHHCNVFIMYIIYVCVFVIFYSFLYVCLMISHKFPPKISGMFVCVYRNGFCTLRSWMHTCVNVSVGGMLILSYIRIHKLWQVYMHRLVCMCVSVFQGVYDYKTFEISLKFSTRLQWFR